MKLKIESGYVAVKLDPDRLHIGMDLMQKAIVADIRKERRSEFPQNWRGRILR